MTDLALTLAVVALIILFLAATALAGFLYLLVTERGGSDPEPPVWVNDGQLSCRLRTRRGTWRERCNT